MSGFLLRSDVVAGWPGLQVDGYDKSIQNNDFVLEWKVYTSTSIDPLYWSEGDKRTIRIGALAKEIADQTKAQTFSAAEFALEMIEGAEKVRFCSIP